MRRKLTLVFIAALSLLSQAEAQNASRLVGRHTVRYDNGWAPYDSATYVYSNGRGGDYNNLLSGTLKYDTAYGTAYYNNTYIPYTITSQTFNGQGYVTERVLMTSNGTTFENTRKTTFTRDGNNNVLEELEQTWTNNNWVNNSHVVATYDGNNNMLTQAAEFWDAFNNTWATSYLTVYWYDGNNNMTRRVNATLNQGTQQYDSTFMALQYYNTNNTVDSSISHTWNSGWDATSKTYNYYDMNNMLVGWLIQNWSGTNNTWENNLRGHNFVNTTQFLGDSIEKWIDYQGAWRNFSRSNYDFAGNNLMEYLYQQWDSASAAFVNNYIDSYAYNSYDQVTWTIRWGWDAANNMWVGNYAFTDNDYYYELYTADVASLEKAAPEMTLFPVPAKGMLNVKLAWSVAEDFVVSIYDIQGRLVRQWSERAEKDYRKAIPVYDLAPGNYILRARGKQGTAEQQFVIAE